MAPFSGSDAIFCPLCRTAWEFAVTEASGRAAEDAARGLVYLTFYRSGRADGVPERLIYHLKHRGDPRVFRFVARRLGPRVLRTAETLPTRAGTDAAEGKRAVLFTYPPRRSSAVRRDGFDQAGRLAKALSETCGGDFVPLIRHTRRHTVEQKELGAEARAENVRGAYKLRGNASALVRGRVVAICDDVCTTGATLNRCACLLVEAGAAAVVLVTVERTESR